MSIKVFGFPVTTFPLAEVTVTFWNIYFHWNNQKTQEKKMWCLTLIASVINPCDILYFLANTAEFFNIWTLSTSPCNIDIFCEPILPHASPSLPLARADTKLHFQCNICLSSSSFSCLVLLFHQFWRRSLKAPLVENANSVFFFFRCRYEKKLLSNQTCKRKNYKEMQGKCEIEALRNLGFRDFRVGAPTGMLKGSKFQGWLWKGSRDGPAPLALSPRLQCKHTVGSATSNNTHTLAILHRWAPLHIPSCDGVNLSLHLHLLGW